MSVNELLTSTVLSHSPVIPSAAEEPKPSRRHAPPLLPRPFGFAQGDMVGVQGDREGTQGGNRAFRVTWWAYRVAIGRST